MPALTDDISDKSFEELFRDDAWEESDAETEETEASEDTTEDDNEETPEDGDDDDSSESVDASEGDSSSEEESDEEDSEEKEEKDEKTDTPKSFTVVVDGQELEVDEEELVRGYATGRASNQRFQEAKNLHEEASTFFRNFMNSPGDALTDVWTHKYGDRTKAREHVKDAFIKWLSPDLEESLIEDPKERELYRRQREIDDRQKELDRRQSEETRRAEEAAEREFITDLKLSITDGLKKHELPDKDEIWVRVGQMVDAALKAGTKRENIRELVPGIVKQVAEERQEAAKKLASTLTAEDLQRMFPDAAEALKKQRIEKVKQERSKKKTGTGKPSKRREKKPKFISTQDAFTVD